MMIRLTHGIGLLPFLACAASGAWAAEAPEIHLGAAWTLLQPTVEALAAALVSGLIAWGAATLRRLAHIDIEARHRDSLHSAAMTGVRMASSRLGASVSGLTVAVRSQIVADAADWVIESVPDALAYLGVTPDRIVPLVESKLFGCERTTAVQGGPDVGPSH